MFGCLAQPMTRPIWNKVGMFGYLAQHTSLADMSHTWLCGQAHFERRICPSRVSLVAAALGLTRSHSPLGFSRHSQPPPRLSPLSRVNSLSPLGFTRSRRAHGLATVISLHPWWRHRARGRARSVDLLGSRLSGSSASLSIYFHLLRKVSPFLGCSSTFICFIFSFDFICFARIALLWPRSVLSSEWTLAVWSPSSQVRSLSYDLDRFSATSKP
jgi:hypothetical protein